MKKIFSYVFLTFISMSLLAQKTNPVKTNVALPSFKSWSLNGNSNINDATNFLGTTDAHKLSFRVNNKLSGFIDFDSFQRNTTYGYQTLVNLSPYGFDNTAIGYQAMQNSTDGHANIALGVRTLFNNTQGSNNTAIGNGSLQGNTTGTYNIAIGGAMTSNTEGLFNIAIGDGALTRNETGRDNIAIGSQALFFSSASENTAVGYFNLYNNTSGTYNTTSGYLSSYNNTVGNNNTAYGAYALYNNTTGSNNTAYGVQALLTNQTGTRITAVGVNADVTDANLKNSTAIGFGAKVDASYKVQIGNMFVKSIGGVVGWTNYADERTKQDVNTNVPGLAFIKELKPVTYHFNTAKANEILGKKDSLNQAGESNIEKIQFTGLIAQDVDAVAKKMNFDFSGVDKTGKIWGLRYSEFIVPVIKALQELNDSLQTITQKQQSQLDALQSKLNAIETRLNQLQPAIASSIESSDAIVKTSNQLSVYPNPAKNSIAVQFNSKAAAAAPIIISDINGNSVMQQSIIAIAGNNNINLNINQLAKGTYILQVQSLHTNLTKKFVKE